MGQVVSMDTEEIKMDDATRARLEQSAKNEYGSFPRWLCKDIRAALAAHDAAVAERDEWIETANTWNRQHIATNEECERMEAALDAAEHTRDQVQAAYDDLRTEHEQTAWALDQIAPVLEAWQVAAKRIHTYDGGLVPWKQDGWSDASAAMIDAEAALDSVIDAVVARRADRGW